MIQNAQSDRTACFDIISVMIDHKFHRDCGCSGNEEYRMISYKPFDELPYDPDKPRIKDLLWNHYDWIEKTHDEGRLRDAILDNVQRTLLCKTVYLGYDAFDCTHCDNWIWLFRHCRSRFCPSCGVKYQKQLSVKAEVMCIDVRHRHMVFTIPEAYREIFRKDRDTLNILFIASRNTMMKTSNHSLFKKIRKKKGIFRNPKDNTYLFRNYKDLCEFGMISTLHTFGRDLKWNPHIHALVPELIYDRKKKEIRHVSHFDYASLRKTWMYEVNRLLKERFPENKAIRSMIDSSYQKQDKGFYVYAKKDVSEEKNGNADQKNVRGCVNYMMRYAGRPVMAESRILSYDKRNDEIAWYYEDHKTEERIDVKETGLCLLEKMIIHIPDKGFRMIRYYGFYHPKCQDLLDEVHRLLGNEKKMYRSRQKRKEELKQKLDRLKFRTLCADTYNRDIFKCVCGHDFYFVYAYNPLEGVSNDRKYRKDCIDEMRRLRLPRGSPGICP